MITAKDFKKYIDDSYDKIADCTLDSLATGALMECGIKATPTYATKIATKCSEAFSNLLSDEESFHSLLSQELPDHLRDLVADDLIRSFERMGFEVEQQKSHVDNYVEEAIEIVFTTMREANKSDDTKGSGLNSVSSSNPRSAYKNSTFY